MRSMSIVRSGLSIRFGLRIVGHGKNHFPQLFRDLKEICRLWLTLHRRYKNNETGRVNAVWPGSSLHYVEAIRVPRYEDYDIEYLGPGKKNLWAFLGMGAVQALVNKEDVSPYLNPEAIDP